MYYTSGMDTFIWLGIAVVLLALQFLTGYFDLLFPALAAFALAALALIPGFAGAPGLQGLVWVLLTFVAVVLLRKRFSNLFRGRENEPASTEFLGEHAVVLEAIVPPAPGRVRFRGTSWKAVSLEYIAVDATVFIEESDGITLTVRELALPETDTGKKE